MSIYFPNQNMWFPPQLSLPSTGPACDTNSGQANELKAKPAGNIHTHSSPLKVNL